MADDEKPVEGDEETARKTAVRTAVESRNGQNEEESDVVELSNGVRIRVRTVPPLILRRPLQDLPEPQPPIIDMSEAKGEGRQEPNPNDPEYIQAHAEWEQTVGLATVDLMLLLGTTEPSEDGEATPLIEHLPDDVLPPESDGWVKWLQGAHIQVDTSSPEARYLCWLRYYALPTTGDVDRLSSAIAGKTGVKDSDVQDAAEAFPGDETRGADPGDSPPSNRADRRAVQRAITRSSRRS